MWRTALLVFVVGCGTRTGLGASALGNADASLESEAGAENHQATAYTCGGGNAPYNIVVWPLAGPVGCCTDGCDVPAVGVGNILFDVDPTQLDGGAGSWTVTASSSPSAEYCVSASGCTPATGTFSLTSLSLVSGDASGSYSLTASDGTPLVGSFSGPACVPPGC